MRTALFTGGFCRKINFKSFAAAGFVCVLSTLIAGCSKSAATGATTATMEESSAKTAVDASGKRFGASDCGCKDVRIADIPGFSPRNRYFNPADIEVSVMLTAASVNLYVIGGGIPDPYPMDSVAKDCQGKYTLTFQQGFPPPHPDSAVIRLEPRKLIFLTGFLIGTGEYDLLFDFFNNQTVRYVPSQDAGTWYVNGLAPFKQKLKINRDLTLDFQSSSDSTKLDRYRIVKVSEDRPDNATLYYVAFASSSGQSQFTQVLVKHFGTLPMVMLNLLGGPIETTPLYYLSK